MKKLSIILTFCLGAALLAGCSGGNTQTTAAETAAQEETTAAQEETTVAQEETTAAQEEAAGSGAALGGWQIIDEQAALSAEEADIFEKAADAWLGAEFTPVAVIASQVVSGTNYCYLAKATTVTAEPTSHYAFVYVYADLQGNAKISATKDIEISIDDAEDSGESTEGLAGGWTIAELDGLNVTNQEILEKALEGFVGSKLAPVACLATQVVSGTNYCFLVKETRVTAEPVSYIALVYVYENLQGEAEILNIHTIDYMPED